MPITASIQEEGIVAEVSEQGIVATVDEELSEIFPPIPPLISISIINVIRSKFPGEIDLETIFSDPNGTVEKVEIFFRLDLGPVILLVTFEPAEPSPRTFNFTNMALGSYCIFAVATDNDGITTQSNMVVQVIVANIIPTGTLEFNSFVSENDPGEVLFDWTASDPDGTVILIELLRKKDTEGSFSVVNSIGSPAGSGQISDIGITEGIYDYKLKVTDNDSATFETGLVNIIILATVSDIITFDSDTTYSNGDTLLEDSDWKIRIEGGGTAVQSGGKLILSASGASSDIAFIEKQEDLRARVKWKIRYAYRHTAGFGTNNAGQVSLRNALAVIGLTNSVHWDGSSSEGRIRLISIGDGSAPNLRYALQHKNTGGNSVNDVFVTGQWAGQEVINSIERKSDRYTMVFDEDDVTVAGTITTDILFSNIRVPHDKDFIQIAASPRTNNLDSIIEINFIDLVTVV